MRTLFGCMLLVVLWPFLCRAERINHAGRILGPMPVVTNVVLFNTPEADAIMAGLQIFPREHPWNEDISSRPLLVNSSAMITQIFTELINVGTNSPKLRAFQEMNFVLVPDSQPPVPIRFVDYPDESDPSPYPIPPNLPIEGWPSQTGTQTLAQVQQDALGRGGDRHSIIIQPGTGYLWETWQSLLVTNAAIPWQAANGARFNLTNLTQRPEGWTSADAAGLSMLGGLVRFDECERGTIEHALRLIVKHTRREFIYPATHHASSPSTTNTNVPAMGQRLRLKASFVVPATWTKQERAIAAALKKYGGLIADNSSSFFSLSVVPDLRWPSGAFSHLTALSVTNFEVIQTTGPNEGPRSPGAPVVHAGLDQTVGRDAIVQLSGAVQYTNTLPLTTRWQQYGGPGQVRFADSNRLDTMVTFTNLGRFTLLLSADDGVHTVAYDAVIITVTNSMRISIQQVGTNIKVGWSGTNGALELQTSPSLPAVQWRSMGTFSTNLVTFPRTSNAAFFRARAVGTAPGAKP